MDYSETEYIELLEDHIQALESLVNDHGEIGFNDDLKAYEKELENINTNRCAYCSSPMTLGCCGNGCDDYPEC